MFTSSADIGNASSKGGKNWRTGKTNDSKRINSDNGKSVEKNNPRGNACNLATSRYPFLNARETRSFRRSDSLLFLNANLPAVNGDPVAPFDFATRFSCVSVVFLPTGPYQKHFVPVTLAEWCQLHKDSCRAQKCRGLLEGIGEISRRGRGRAGPRGAEKERGWLESERERRGSTRGRTEERERDRGEQRRRRSGEREREPRMEGKPNERRDPTKISQ